MTEPTGLRFAFADSCRGSGRVQGMTRGGSPGSDGSALPGSGSPDSFRLRSPHQSKTKSSKRKRIETKERAARGWRGSGCHSWAGTIPPRPFFRDGKGRLQTYAEQGVYFLTR
jgi:hypothetical protein